MKRFGKNLRVREEFVGYNNGGFGATGYRCSVEKRNIKVGHKENGMPFKFEEWNTVKLFNSLDEAFEYASNHQDDYQID